MGEAESQSEHNCVVFRLRFCVDFSLSHAHAHTRTGAHTTNGWSGIAVWTQLMGEAESQSEHNCVVFRLRFCVDFSLTHTRTLVPVRTQLMGEAASQSEHN